MKGFREKFGAVADNYSAGLKYVMLVGSIAIILLMLYTSGDVMGRYLLNSPLPASFELSTILLVVIVYFSLASVQASRGHLRLEFLCRRFTLRGQAGVLILSSLIGLFLFTIIAWQGWQWALRAWQMGEHYEGIWRIPYFPSRLILTIGAFLLCIQYGIELVHHISQLLTTRKGSQQQ